MPFLLEVESPADPHTHGMSDVHRRLLSSLYAKGGIGLSTNNGRGFAIESERDEVFRSIILLLHGAGCDIWRGRTWKMPESAHEHHRLRYGEPASGARTVTMLDMKAEIEKILDEAHEAPEHSEEHHDEGHEAGRGPVRGKDVLPMEKIHAA